MQYNQRSTSTTSATPSEKNVRTSNPVLADSNQDRLNSVKDTSLVDIAGTGLGYAGLLLSDMEISQQMGLDAMLPERNVSGALSLASAAVTGIQSFQDSPNQTMVGRGLDALLDVSGSLMVGANPMIAAVDTLMPKELKPSRFYDGASSAVSSMTEGLLCNDSTGMEQFMEKAKEGEYSFLMKEAVEAGEYWSNWF